MDLLTKLTFLFLCGSQPAWSMLYPRCGCYLCVSLCVCVGVIVCLRQSVCGCLRVNCLCVSLCQVGVCMLGRVGGLYVYQKTTTYTYSMRVRLRFQCVYVLYLESTNYLTKQLLTARDRWTSVSTALRSASGGQKKVDSIEVRGVVRQCESLPVKRALMMSGVEGGEVEGGQGQGWEGRETPGGGETPLTPRDFFGESAKLWRREKLETRRNG